MTYAGTEGHSFFYKKQKIGSVFTVKAKNPLFEACNFEYCMRVCDYSIQMQKAFSFSLKAFYLKVAPTGIEPISKV